ncbi:MAG: inorganic phosphate transporter [Magnetococcales bacterium]|nr:inorganic phosphate transporter [Magnetococcales bacterium]
MVLIAITIVAVLGFDFTNGFHDASNMTASAVACGAMTPIKAVVLVSIFTFVGPLLGGTAVANTIGKIVTIHDQAPLFSTTVILSGMLSAIFWNLLTWWKGMPSSSSHALVGGMVGATAVAVGGDHVIWGFDTLFHEGHLTGFAKVLVSLLISPPIGFLMGLLVQRVMLFLLGTLATPSINRPLRYFQYVTTSGLAFAHGTNDAQKSMGIIALVLFLNGISPTFEVPWWVMLVCALAITLGTLFGGWRIARTLAFDIYKLRSVHALDSQLASSLVVLGASHLGAPVSTTHVVGSTIMGIGTAEYPKRVRWAMAFEIVATWMITIPCSALVAVLFWYSLEWVVR